MSDAGTPETGNPVGNPVGTREGRNGGTLRTGGTNPNAGRPPNEFKENLRRLVTRTETEAYLQKCLNGEEGPKAFAAAIAYATDHGYGRAPQSIALTGADGEPLFKVYRNVSPDEL